MVYVVLCPLRESASQWAHHEAQRLSCTRLPRCVGHLHCFHLSAASLGFAAWSHDHLPELGTQNLKVPLSLEPWSRLLTSLTVFETISLVSPLMWTSFIPCPYLRMSQSLTINYFPTMLQMKISPAISRKLRGLVSASSFWHLLFHIADSVMFIASTLPPAVWASYLCQLLPYLFLPGEFSFCSHRTVSQERFLCSKLLTFLFLLVLQEKTLPPH